MPSKSSPRTTARGFTLIELLVVVAVLGIVAAIAIPNMLRAMEKSRHTASYTNVKVMEGAIQAYMLDNNGPPATVNTATLAPLHPRYMTTGTRNSVLGSLDQGRVLSYWGWNGGWWGYDYMIAFRPRRDDPRVWCYLYPEGIYRWDPEDGWAMVD